MRCAIISFERIGKTQTDRQPYHDQWAQVALLVAAQEIANSTKHFALRNMRSGALRPSKTKRVVLGRNTFADVYVSTDGHTMVFPRRGSDIFVVLSDNTRHELYSFMIGILSYWRGFLQSNGIRVRRQTFRKLRGSVT